MTIAASIPGAPLANPTQLAPPPALGQAAVTTSVRVTPQALTANGEANFRPQELPTKPSQNNTNQQVQFSPQGGGGAAGVARPGAANPTAQTQGSLPSPLNTGSPINLNTPSTTMFLAQLAGQHNGFLQGNALNVFSSLSAALQQNAAPKQNQVQRNQENQQLRDMRQAAMGTSGGKTSLTRVDAKPETLANMPVPYQQPKVPRPILPAGKDLVRVQAGNKQYAANQLFVRSPTEPKLPEGTRRTTVS